MAVAENMLSGDVTSNCGLPRAGGATCECQAQRLTIERMFEHERRSAARDVHEASERLRERARQATPGIWRAVPVNGGGARVIGRDGEEVAVIRRRGGRVPCRHPGNGRRYRTTAGMINGFRTNPLLPTLRPAL